jgi:hypothetical protein
LFFVFCFIFLSLELESIDDVDDVGVRVWPVGDEVDEVGEVGETESAEAGEVGGRVWPVNENVTRVASQQHVDQRLYRQRSSSKKDRTVRTELGQFRSLYLRNEYSYDLLVRYYNELLIPNIPVEDERETLEVIDKALKRPTEELRVDKDNVLPYVNVCLLLDESGNEKATLAGAVQFEYYCTPNCGLITYLCVNGSINDKGIPILLAELAQKKLEVIAKFFGHLAGVLFFFLFVFFFCVLFYIKFC